MVKVIVASTIQKIRVNSKCYAVGLTPKCLKSGSLCKEPHMAQNQRENIVVQETYIFQEKITFLIKP